MDQCLVFYESWQYECCGKGFTIGSHIKWRVMGGKHIHLPIQAEIDYSYEAHTSEYEKLSVLEGEVKEIQLYYKKRSRFEDPERWAEPLCVVYDFRDCDSYRSTRDGREFVAFLVTVENYSIRPAVKDDLTF